MTRCSALQISHARIVHAGIVIIHASTMLPPTPHFTADSLFEAPTPMIVDEITCVVERGSPILDATSITVAAAVSAANPWIGLRCTSFTPRVLMILQPPTAVPHAIAVAHIIITQNGTWKSGRCVITH